MTNDLTILTDDGKVNVRTAAWIEHDGKLLVCKFFDGVISLPGGRIKFGETSLEAVKREVYEEVGEKPKLTKFMAVIENLFDLKVPYHEYLFVYRVEIDYKSEYQPNEENNQTLFWIDMNEIDSLQPKELLKLKGLYDDKLPLHLVNID